jgi:predicted SnoaL-like aldol condensation-catalyzing enzyme
MNFLTPSRLIAVAALVVAGLSFGIADAGTRHGPGHSSKACPGGKHQLERNKRTVVAYYTTAFNDKNPRLAVERYGGSEYIQHNPLAANGFDAFIGFVEGLTGTYPDVHIDIRRVFAECDHVITHGLLTGAAPVFTERGNKVVDIFRLDRNGKIVEHWDVLAPISASSANGNPEV